MMKKTRVDSNDDLDLDSLADQLFASDNEDDPDTSRVTSKVSSKSASGSEGDEKGKSNPESIVPTIPQKRVRHANPGKPKSRPIVFGNNGEKRHNLYEMAQNGQGGRVTFVLEKVTASKM